MSDRAFEIWLRVAARLRKWEKVKSLFRYGQDESLAWIADRLPKNGLLVADEVGLGKTRIALLAMYATMLEGGTVAAVVPPGLLFQWQEEADNVWDSLLEVKAVEPSVTTPECIAIRTYGDLFTKAGGSLCYPLCSVSPSRWPLISQAFDLYIIKKGAFSWRLELPALVNAYMREKTGEDRKNRWFQYLRTRGYYDQKIEEGTWFYNYREAAKFLAKGGRSAYPAELRAVFDDDDLRPDTRDDTDWRNGHRAREECVEFFQNGRPGRKLLMNMVGIRYAYGLQCEFDELEEEVKGTADRKQQRARFWQRLQKNLSAEISGKTGNWLWNHPRILRSADRIEELCSIDNGRPKDKVLVFGRFTQPLHALCDVLNARHLLRIIDLGILAFPPKVDRGLLRAVWKERRERGTEFRGVLAKLTKADLRAMEQDARRRYERERDRLTHLISADREVLCSKLPGHNAIAELGTKPKEQRDLFTILRAEVFDVMLQDGRDVESVTLDELRKLLTHVWKDHCACMLHGRDDILTRDEQVTADDERLDARADQLSPAILVDYFGLGKPGESDARSHFCRVLDGSVKPRTRRSIQSGFNDRARGPHVLVAQSLVGREGLNLHKACRKVFLLHPEWNPGIMEQQIGRVDRIESLWTRMAKEWLGSHGINAPADDFPKIEIESVVFKGTYDEFQFQVLSERRKSLNAQLFGELLDEQTLARIPQEYRGKVASAAPDWSPTKKRST